MKNNGWKPKTQHPNDDENILVTWKSRDSGFVGPYRAYYYKVEDKYFHLDGDCNMPLDIDFWIEMPEMPK